MITLIKAAQKLVDYYFKLSIIGSEGQNGYSLVLRLYYTSYIIS